MVAPVLTVEQMNDLRMTTQRNLGKPKFTEIATDLREYTVLDNLMRKNRVSLQSGIGVQWDVMVNHSNSAENVGMGASDDVDIVDTMVQAQADWRKSAAHYAILDEEMSMNREPERIVDLFKTRRIACMIALAELMEHNFWGPPVTLTDEVTPWGINTWVVKNAVEGFNGGAPAGHTTIGLNPTTYPRWRNYTAQYSAISQDDLIRKWRKAATKTNFKPPVKVPDFNTGNKYGYYSSYDVIAPLEEELRTQNDNLGNDIASKDGMTLFRRSPVMDIPILEADTTGPIYGINWGTFKLILLSGWWLRELNVPHYPGQHTMNVTFLDIIYQWVCYDRRRNFVLATGTSYPA